MKCKKCGHKNRQGVDFCEECGEKLIKPPQIEVPMNSIVCKNCGYVNRSEIAFCEECGTKLTISQEPEKIVSIPISIETKQTPEKSITCSNCGFQNRAEVAFCEECGEKLSPTTAKQKISPTLEKVLVSKKTEKIQACPKCGYKNRGEVIFCEECGVYLALPHPKVRTSRDGMKKFFTSLSAYTQSIQSSIAKNPFRTAFYTLAAVCLVIGLIIAFQFMTVRYTRSNARHLADTVVYSLYPEMRGIEPQVDHYKENNSMFSTYSYINNLTGHIQGGSAVEFTVNIVININRTSGTFKLLSVY